MHKLKVTISARLYDHHGKLIRKYRPRAAHSFLAQFIELLHAEMSSTETSITMTNGAEGAFNQCLYNFRIDAPATDFDYGILIGSGDTPVDIDDYALETPLTADLAISDTTFVLSYPTAASRRMAISRTFTNQLASPRAIEEVVIYCYNQYGTYVCIDRTLYSIGIAASSSLELTYRIDVSV